MLKTSDFDYDLPRKLVAVRPTRERSAAAMMVLNRHEKSITDSTFSSFCDYLRPGDRVVFNNTRVIPGRIFGHKKTGAAVEILCTAKIDDHRWNAIVRPGRKLRPGAEILTDQGDTIHVEALTDQGGRILRSERPLREIMEEQGEMPIPPYLQRGADERDRRDYQTVFAQKEGAVAAPTAGLHFDDSLLQGIRSAGADISYVTLHVGIGTFRPVTSENPLEHPMHSEEYEITPECAAEIAATKSAGGRIFAIGTTVVRTLESAALDSGQIRPGRRSTELMIFPGYSFQMVDALVTNFHLPKSTLLMLVSAFYDRGEVFRAYAHAVEKEYRFYSYGDGMLII
ncbi:MAG: tRNA preQ1(34) S-adenosylmethionine ribosyltransferase-isomerase QueA [Fibrobacterota bacterium]